MSATVTMDFREEYEAERTRWLRRRFLWYSGVLAVYYLLNLVFWLSFGLAGETMEQNTGLLSLYSAMFAAQTALFVGAFLAVRRAETKRESLDRSVFALTVISGSISILAAPIFARLGATDAVAALRAEVRAAPFVAMFSAHFIASLFIPWTAREALRPLLALVIVFAVTTLALGTGSFPSRLLLIVLAPLVGLPGLAIAWWRHSRFRQHFHYRMLRRRYGELQRELVDARRIHEALFPRPILDGPVRLQYRYEPMRQIGGDYLYACLLQGPDGSPSRLNVVLIDVTGHGVAAALTVNRLYGELERLFAEDPNLSPGGLIVALNRYVNLTLAKHAVYATALALRVDGARDVLEWANAGHPPAFVRTGRGHIERIDSTTSILGVFGGEDFAAGERSIVFRPGDTLIAYTDGATDAKDESGERLRIDGIQNLFAACRPDADDRGRWSSALLREIDRHRFGASADDTLLVEVWRPVG